MNSETLKQNLIQANSPIEEHMLNIIPFLSNEMLEQFRASLIGILNNSIDPSALEVAKTQLQMLELALGAAQNKHIRGIGAILTGEKVVAGSNLQASNDESYKLAA